MSMPPQGRAALRAGVVGNLIDNVHVFLPLTALAPAMAVLGGPAAAASRGTLIVVAMLLGRPLGGILFGRLADRFGRTRTTRWAIGGTAACALAIALMPGYAVLGTGTIALIVALRFIGGVFVAGEYSAAIPLAMEWSHPQRRGLMSGLILSMAPWAQGLIAFAVGILLLVLGPDAYAQWGWRVLFGLGAAASIGMLIYYARHVEDAQPQQHGTTLGYLSGIAHVLGGQWARAFWQVFTLMSGLWLLTNTTVLLLTPRLADSPSLDPTSASTAIGVASVAQALAMVLAGHVSTPLGRRRLFVLWGAAATVLGPVLWLAAVDARSLLGAAAGSAALQVVTVAAYGPVSAYLSERFPAAVRSTGYGMGYSLSLVIPALHPLYLPSLARVLGADGAVIALTITGGLLLIAGAALGPRLSRADFDAPIDEVAAPATPAPQREETHA